MQHTFLYYISTDTNILTNSDLLVPTRIIIVLWWYTVTIQIKYMLQLVAIVRMNTYIYNVYYIIWNCATYLLLQRVKTVCLKIEMKISKISFLL